MQPLNFPKYDFRFKNSQNSALIFDIVRKKFVVLTPEEWVRQHALMFLSIEKKYPLSHINVEKQILYNGLRKRYDIVVFNPNGSIHLLVECKAPHINISQTTFDQIAQYNFKLKASYLMVTNGLEHYMCQMNFKEEKYIFLKEIPEFSR
ncbi:MULTISPECIES: type I restriction enzyme HsdR N-terminal domain-containing protein [Maribacter]|uniref:Type I restriction enzyme HsdR N-terminal domain-containing protein n=1 Tax=Maribacter flavus TaxID=1658664 RepID=A0A5B2TSD7_9FLAO|nr:MULTISPECIES: type I restriction enzyme HsdR N-terminal domain-containing protein [Maribacter]KAA2217234.1 type I restriction enzyme HsdR N-terminal domain-containing protein [Maribacter flavus]MDC6405905.1 type I restriction enzyme HsdR N-terminal domain-containing protein [Maribacter sp. PR66]MEE1972843.1 type I restriction enzyme HsdR N-terminal domain-containing protein [Maribacter flavus]